MADLKKILAENLYELRCARGLTQLTFAEKMNYSDKAISKWERAESVPDIFTLKKIADFYGVGVDYLLTRDHPKKDIPAEMWRRSRRVRIMVSLISIVGVWLLALLYFAIHCIAFADALLPAWMTFIYATVVSSIVAIVFNTVWGNHRLNCIYVSILMWSAILSLYLTLLTVSVGAINIWMLFLLGIPGEIIVILTAPLARKSVRREEKNEE